MRATCKNLRKCRAEFAAICECLTCLGRLEAGSEREVLNRPNPSVRHTNKAHTPAFMQIEGRIARTLPSEATNVNTRKFWLVQPWVIVTLVIAIMAALMIPGLLMDLNRGF